MSSSAVAPPEISVIHPSPQKAASAAGPAAGASSLTPVYAFVALTLAAVIIAVPTAVVLSRSTSSDAAPSGAVRTYHLAVEEVAWQYAPSGFDNCSGLSAADSEHASTFISADAAAGLIGDTYWRRRYFSYEPDGSFSVPRAGDWWAHAGVQGPTLRAAVGDVLRVRLLNRGRFPASFYVQGLPLDSVSRIIDNATTTSASANSPPSSPRPLLYTLVAATLSFFTGTATSRVGALSETPAAASADHPMDPFASGARRSICTGSDCAAVAANSSLIVQPGQVFEFSWTIRDSAGPQGVSGSSTVGRLYSALEYDGFTDPGLAGVLVVARRGDIVTSPPADIAAERAAIFSVAMESQSPYLPLNVLDFVWRARVAARLSTATPATSAASTKAISRARLATAPSAAQVPIPSSVTPAALLAALFNAATGGYITTTHPAITSALGSAAGGLTQNLRTATFPASLLGVSLGSVGATLFAGSLLGGMHSNRDFDLLNATAFAALHGQWTLEAALAPLALSALEAEPTFDADYFEESNTMHGLNGLLFCNRAALPGAELPTALLGATTRWYVAVLGTEVDLHAAHWHGNTVMEVGGYRSDSIALLPRQIATVDMRAHAPGKWLFHCHITDHIEAGMLALYEAVPMQGDSVERWMPIFANESSDVPSDVLPAPAYSAELASGRLREYFIQAEVGNWSYLSGPVVGTEEWLPESAAMPPLQGNSYTPHCGAVDTAALDARYNGSLTWPKARFVRYTDATFTQRWVPPNADEAARWAHLEILGPILRGEVGDTLRVLFRNAAPVPFSVHPHGVVYPKGSEGAPYADATGDDVRDTGDDAVHPGETWPYTWFLPETSGPASGDPSSVPWLYHGHVHEAGDENTGLIGVLLVTGRGLARVPGSALEADLRPADVDRELVVMAKVFSEGAASEEVHAHFRPYPLHDSINEEDFSTFFTLNGLIACRLSLAAAAGERVRLYGVSLGNEIDLHTLGVSGHALTFRGKHKSGLSLIPGTMYAADFVAEGGGGWLLGSSVISHAELGMMARFDVSGVSSSSSNAVSAPVRDYFLAAVEVEWDYTPAGQDLCVSDAFKASSTDAFPPLDPTTERFSADGTDLQGFPLSVRTFVDRVVGGAHIRIGRRYLKARYLGFTDGAFRSPLIDAHNSSTGILGPALRATPGDVLRIVLRNNLTFPINLDFPAAPLHLMSLRERRVGDAAWSAPLVGSPAELAARALEPGWEAEASWSVLASAAPGASDAPTIAWAYKSTVASNHLYAGLVGGLIVAASPAALVPGSATHGAAREYILAWFISNENNSPYLEDNVALASGTDLSYDADFEESNLKHAVSGRLACNLGSLVALRGERVRFHFLGLGAELDMHTPQSHGFLVAEGGGPASYAAAMKVHPGTRATVDLEASTGGKWLLECGVNDHWAAGMRALLAVLEPSSDGSDVYYEESTDYALAF